MRRFWQTVCITNNSLITPNCNGCSNSLPLFLIPPRNLLLRRSACRVSMRVDDKFVSLTDDSNTRGNDNDELLKFDPLVVS